MQGLGVLEGLPPPEPSLTMTARHPPAAQQVSQGDNVTERPMVRGVVGCVV